jgi:hypothetical protein
MENNFFVLFQIQKKSFMGDIPAFLSRCYGDDQYPGGFRFKDSWHSRQ